MAYNKMFFFFSSTFVRSHCFEDNYLQFFSTILSKEKLHFNGVNDMCDSKEKCFYFHFMAQDNAKGLKLTGTINVM